MRFAMRRFARLRFASMRFAQLSSAQLSFAPMRFAPASCAPRRWASLRSTLLRFAPMRFAPASCAPPSFAPLRSAPASCASPSFASMRSGLTKRLPARHRFHSFDPFRITLVCCGSAIPASIQLALSSCRCLPGYFDPRQYGSFCPGSSRKEHYSCEMSPLREAQAAPAIEVFVGRLSYLLTKKPVRSVWGRSDAPMRGWMRSRPGTASLVV